MASAPTSRTRRSPRFIRTPATPSISKDTNRFHSRTANSLRVPSITPNRLFPSSPPHVNEETIDLIPSPTAQIGSAAQRATPSPVTAEAASLRRLTNTQAASGASVLTQEEEEHADELAKVYTFLCGLRKDVLRKMGRQWGRRATGNKDALLYRNFLFLKECHESNKSMESKMLTNIDCPSYEKFLDDQERTCADWKRIPAIDEMVKCLTAAGDKFDDNTGVAANLTVRPNSLGNRNNEGMPNFSISEFARLVIVMRDDEKARSALYRLGQELRRAELDSGTSRDAFWGIIEDRFNDTTVPVRFSFAGHVDEADPSRAPACRRPAASLKTHFYEARSVFTDAVDKWMRSGQNDPDKFPDFLSKNGQNLYASSKRALILFVAARLGTPYEDTFFVEMASKTILDGGYEAGMGRLANHNRTDDGDAGSSFDGSRRRKRNSVDMSEVFGKQMDKFGEQIGRVVSQLSDPHAASTSIMPDNAALTSWKDNESMFSIVESAMLAFERAKKLPDAEFVAIAKMRYEKALESYKGMFREN